VAADGHLRQSAAFKNTFEMHLVGDDYKLFPKKNMVGEFTAYNNTTNVNAYDNMIIGDGDLTLDVNDYVDNTPVINTKSVVHRILAICQTGVRLLASIHQAAPLVWQWGQLMYTALGYYTPSDYVNGRFTKEWLAKNPVCVSLFSRYQVLDKYSPLPAVPKQLSEMEDENESFQNEPVVVTIGPSVRRSKTPQRK
jgi:hypothetical protein